MLYTQGAVVTIPDGSLLGLAMTTSPDQLAAESSSTSANPVKLEHEEQDELAPDSPQDGKAVSSSKARPPSSERSPSASAQANSNGTLPNSGSHQQLQQVLLQQQQLHRSRPLHVGGAQENGVTTAARALAHAQNRCALCGATNVPLWRKEPNGQAICNSCGK